MASASNITVRLFPSLISLPALIYWYNDCSNHEIKYEKTETPAGTKMTATVRRNLFPFFPKREHVYTVEKSDISENQFRHLVQFEIRHPLLRSFVRPLFYVDKLPYPSIST